MSLTQTMLSIMEETAFLPEPQVTLEVNELGETETNEVVAFLSERPIHTVCMMGMIRDNGLTSEHNRGTFYGCRNSEGRLEGVALIGHATLIETRTRGAIRELALTAQIHNRLHMIMAEQEKVDIRLHTIIYEVVDEMKKAMSGLLAPVYKETYRGKAEIRETFRVSRVGTVAGCLVDDGVITRNSEIRLLRDNVVVHKGKIEGLKRFKNDASEVKNGFECGVSLANYNDLKPGDVIEAFVTERVAHEAFV